MGTIALKHTRNQQGDTIARLVHRAHDLSGVDYEALTKISLDLAHSLGDDGVVIMLESVCAHAGRPGVVFSPGDASGTARMSVRRDVADATSSTHNLVVDADLPRQVLEGAELDLIRWVLSPPPKITAY